MTPIARQRQSDMSTNHTNHTNEESRKHWLRRLPGPFVTFVWFVDNLDPPRGVAAGRIGTTNHTNHTNGGSLPTARYESGMSGVFAKVSGPSSPPRLRPRVQPRRFLARAGHVFRIAAVVAMDALRRQFQHPV